MKRKSIYVPATLASIASVTLATAAAAAECLCPVSVCHERTVSQRRSPAADRLSGCPVADQLASL